MENTSSTSTGEDLTFLSDFVFAPKCEYGNGYTRPDDCSNSAVLLVVYTNPWPCGCPPTPPTRYFCSSCWERRNFFNHVTHWEEVGGCGKSFGTSEGLAQITYL